MKLSNIFIGRASGNNITMILSALFIGQTITTLLAFPIAEGFGAYVNVLCSQAYGAKQYRLVGLYFYRALFMAALTCFPVFTVFMSVRPIVYLLFQDWELAQYTGSFTDVLCFGYPAYLYYKIGFRFLQALNIVWGPVLYLIIGNILNGVIQYILIFQYNTTLAGAAAGYVISNYLVALLVFTHIQLSHVHTLIAHKWTIEYITNWLHTARYAVVPFFQMLVGGSQSTLAPILFIGIISDDKKQLAIYSVIFSLWWVFSLGSLGFSSAVTVRMGHFIGANDPKGSKRSAVTGVILAQSCLLACSLLLLIFSKPVSYLFTTDPSFAEELQWNIRIFSVFINTGIKAVIQGAMNACCKQGIQFILRFVYQIILGNIVTVLVVQFVQWKALSILIIYTGTDILCSLTSISILACSNWKNIGLVVSKNTLEKTRIKDESKDSRKNKSSLGCIVLVYIRYMLCISMSVFIFTSVVFMLSYKI